MQRQRHASAKPCELRASRCGSTRVNCAGVTPGTAQIKKHIHDCALFIPVISAHTNARTEGYFRREWKLATRRLLDMADDAAFLVPVVIDETREADARVPEEFLQAQWTWLPGGETPPAFAQRVRQLLGAGSVPPVTRSQRHRKVRAKRSSQVRPQSQGAAGPARGTRRHCAAAGSGRWGVLVLPRRERRTGGEVRPAHGIT